MSRITKPRTALQEELQALRQRVTELEAQHNVNADRERRQREEQNRWRLFVTHAPVAMAMLDRQMRYLAVSDRWQTEYGLDAQDLIGRSHYDIFPEIPDDWKAVHQRALGGAVERRDEDRFLRHDGTVQWLRWEVQPWQEPNGDIRGVILFSEDITARKEAEASLRQSEDRWQLALRGSNAGMWDWNPQTNTAFFSTRWKTMLGFGEDEIGTSLSEWSDRVHPDDLPQIMHAIEEHFAGKTEFYENEHRVSCKDGTYKWILDRGQALWDAQGKVVRAGGSHTDITARKRAEDWMSSLIASTQDAMISIDRQARVVLFNPSAERIFGYRAVEVVGEKVNVLMAEPYANEHDDYLARYERTHERRAIGRIRTVTGKRKNGDVFPMELSVTEIGSDEEVHYAAFIRDISEKVRLQDKVVEHERLATIGFTAAKLAHEIGNPLNSMTLSVQMLERRLASTGSEDTIVARVRGLRDQITRLTHLLQEFRNLSRRQDYRLVPTNLTALATEVLTAEMENYATRGVTLVHESAPSLPLVKADVDKLRQVLVNLCKNAVEAMPEGGTLTVSVQPDGNGRVHLHITDTGSGIPDGVNIFEPFITTKPEGTGLGLPVVRQIVAAHGGELTYRTALGQGTTFTVTLVVMDEETPAPPDIHPSLQRTS